MRGDIGAVGREATVAGAAARIRATAAPADTGRFELFSNAQPGIAVD